MASTGKSDTSIPVVAARLCLDDQADDLDHIMWITNHIERPYAELEASMDRALQCTTFTGLMAAMEGYINIDPTKLPPALSAKWDQVLTQIAEATVFGECRPFGG